MICRPKLNERKRVLAHTTVWSEKANALVQMRQGSCVRFLSQIAKSNKALYKLCYRLLLTG